MNIQSFNLGQQNPIIQQPKTETTNNEFAEKLMSNYQQSKKQKSIMIGNYFECTEEAKFVVAIAKFSTVFNLNVEQISCIKKLSKKQIAYIKDYNFESVLADTNRKQFIKFFQKSTKPQLSLTATFCNIQGLILIIQNPQNQNQKSRIKFLNYQNLIHSVLSNIKLNEGLEYLTKVLEQKYRKTTSVICFEKLKGKNTQNNKQFVSYLLSKFQQVIYITVNNQSIIHPYYDKIEQINSQNKNIYKIKNQNWQVLSIKSLNQQILKCVFNIYNNHNKVDQIIFKQLQNTKISKSVFVQNLLCINYYGVYYNFICLNGFQNCQNLGKIQQSFLNVLINQKQQFTSKVTKDQKKLLNRKLGHYPSKIDKGSKVCCVCQLNKKKKTRYKCQKCSDTYKRDIAICLDHFKQYHDNMYKYIPKGVRKGAYRNQIEQFEEVVRQDDEIQSQKKQQKLSSSHKQQQSVSDILLKWQSQTFGAQQKLSKFAGFYSQAQYNNNYLPVFYYSEPGNYMSQLPFLLAQNNILRNIVKQEPDIQIKQQNLQV